MSVNKIKKEDNPDLFEQIIDDNIERSFEEHRRGSNFYIQTVHEIDQELLPDHPELWGFWETNTYIWDDNYGSETDEIYELNRVEQREKIIKTMEWVQVQEEQAIFEEKLPII